jgi:hypothetical protein
MKPKTDLVHPEATYIVRHGNSTQELPMPHIKIYEGRALQATFPDSISGSTTLSQSSKSGNTQFDIRDSIWVKDVGSARLTLHSESTPYKQEHGWVLREPVLEGSFYVGDEQYHVRPLTSYLVTKSKEDPELASKSSRRPQLRNAQMMVWRDSDYKRLGEFVNNNGKERTCGNVNMKEDTRVYFDNKLVKRANAPTKCVPLKKRKVALVVSLS